MKILYFVVALYLALQCETLDWLIKGSAQEDARSPRWIEWYWSPKIIENKIKFVDQNHHEATYANKIEKIDGKINWSESAELIQAKIKISGYRSLTLQPIRSSPPKSETK